MNARPGLLILRLVLGLVAGGYSLALVVTQLSGPTHHALLLLGLAELAAAILFLIPSTVRLGEAYSMGFLAVYGAAAFAAISPGART